MESGSLWRSGFDQVTVPVPVRPYGQRRGFGQPPNSCPPEQPCQPGGVGRTGHEPALIPHPESGAAMAGNAADLGFGFDQGDAQQRQTGEFQAGRDSGRASADHDNIGFG